MKREEGISESQALALELPMQIRTNEAVSWSYKIEDRPIYEIVKRLIGFILSLFALFVIWPILVIVAIAVKLESKGPAIYKQVRVGRNGKEFTMYKFRSMVMDADKHLEEIKHLNECDGPVFKITHDPRLTRVGAFIRKTSLDELPQLLNILSGKMSFVGPRPPLPCEVAQYTDYERIRLSVNPGLTCYWQISGRSDISFQQWMKLDMQYINERSLWTDAKIILKTFPAVLVGRGAC